MLACKAKGPAGGRAFVLPPGVPGGRIGRDDWIRTSDPLTPSQVRYQAALHPDADGAAGALRRNSLVTDGAGDALRSCSNTTSYRFLPRAAALVAFADLGARDAAAFVAAD